MGKRTNTILQSAFFKLADVMPIDEAVEYMKAAAKKSYCKKGDAVVEMNYKAIDAGVDAVHKVEVPADLGESSSQMIRRQLKEQDVQLLLRWLTNFLIQSLRWMVTAFQFQHSRICADGQFETGASAYEKRGTAVMVPEWDPASCVQCNSCAFVCSHATIRPFILAADEVSSSSCTTLSLLILSMQQTQL